MWVHMLRNACYTRKSFHSRMAAPLALLVCLLVVPTASADVLKFVGPSTPYMMGGVEISPYKIYVNGVGVGLLISDDFQSEINQQYKWAANRVEMTSVAANGPQKFQTDGVFVPNGSATTYEPYTVEQKYNAAAFLALQIFQNKNNSILGNAVLAGEYSFAIWQIFYSTAIYGVDGQQRTGDDLTSSQQKVVGKLMEEAFFVTQGWGADDTAEKLGLYLYTPAVASRLLSSASFSLGASNVVTPSPASSAREVLGFKLVSVPEASILAFLAFDFLALIGVCFFLRRRASHAASSR